MFSATGNTRRRDYFTRTQVIQNLARATTGTSKNVDNDATAIRVQIILAVGRWQRHERIPQRS